MPLHSMLATPDVAPDVDADHLAVLAMQDKVAVLLTWAAPPPCLRTLGFLQPHLLLAVGSGIEHSEPPKLADSEAQDDLAAQLPLWVDTPPDAVLHLSQVAEL